jgi:pyridoxamine 5'-phosphate oxidase
LDGAGAAAGAGVRADAAGAGGGGGRAGGGGAAGSALAETGGAAGAADAEGAASKPASATAVSAGADADGRGAEAEALAAGFGRRAATAGAATTSTSAAIAIRKATTERLSHPQVAGSKGNAVRATEAGMVDRELAPDADPLELLASWYRDAVASGAAMPDAVALATATPEGRPSARTVLYKGQSGGGLLFFTNYTSRKARELDVNPRAALLFYWSTLTRQIRVEGCVERLPAAESDAYFATRARESQLGARASPQSKPIESRAELDRCFEVVEREYDGRDVPRPEFWGGYRLVPDAIEFWIGREHRLHDRYAYTRSASGGWTLERLAP